ncbi:MAG: hypothetical protein GC206_13305 [Alphaproteobacteria bacterium]|nr:hypothetical protein [Alphaproteobacteria bacterium]
MKSRPIQPQPDRSGAAIGPQTEGAEKPPAPLPDLDALDRTALMAIAKAGGGRGYVKRPRNVTLTQVIRFRTNGLVETLGGLDIDNSVELKVTARGLKTIAASSAGMSR